MVKTLNSFVSLQLAESLRRSGFNLNCEYIWETRLDKVYETDLPELALADSETRDVIIHDADWNSEDASDILEWPKFCDETGKPFTYISGPRYSQVIEWLEMSLGLDLNDLIDPTDISTSLTEKLISIVDNYSKIFNI